MGRLLIPSRRNPTWSDAMKVKRSRGHNSLAPGLWRDLNLLFSGKQAGGNTWFDISGDGKNGTLTNGPTWVTTEKDWALDFTRTDDGITVPASRSFADLNEFTYAIRVKHDTLGADADLLVQGTHAGTAPFLLWADFAGPVTYKMLAYDGVDESGVKTSAFVPTTDVWYDLVMTFRAGSHFGLFVDGVEDTNSPFATAIGAVGNDSTNVYLGNDSVFVSKGLDGQIADARFWRRVLSLSEVQQLHERPNAMLTPRPLQVAVGAAVVGNPWYFYANQTVIAG